MKCIKIFAGMGSAVFAVLLILIFVNDDWYANAIPPENLSALFEGLNNEQASPEIEKILGQPFLYLDEGGQSYVFVSADGRYVLKLFKFHRFRTQWFIHRLPNLPFLANYREKHILRRKKRLNDVLIGHQLAFELNKEASGLLFLQLRPTHSSIDMVIVDKAGKKRIVDLGRVSFVLQEKGETLSDIFSKLLDRGEVEEVKAKILLTLELYQEEYRKGIYDTDHGVMHNIGFVGDKPLHLDVGNFVYGDGLKEPSFYREDLLKVANKISQWIEKNYPQYHREIYRS